MNLSLPRFFSNHMVLQRERPIRIFGHAPAGRTVEVELGAVRVSTKAKRRGAWSAELPALPAGGSHTLRIACGRQQLKFRDILIGDLWFCSGQSNMEFPVADSLGAKSAISRANLPLIRHFKTERMTADRPMEDVRGHWTVCDPKTAGQFTAVGFYFAREIHRKTGVPVGLIHSSWGGTPIESWIPPEAYRAFSALKPLLKREATLTRPGRTLQTMFRKWEKEQVSIDTGNQGEAWGWARTDFDDRAWGRLKVPGFWEGQGLAIDGAVWFRRRCQIPAAWRGRALRLELGPIDDFDQTYCNGTKIGSTGPEVPDAFNVSRIYKIPENITTSAQVTLAVRIFDRFGSGGFVGRKEMLKLSCPDRPDDQAVPLAGRWRYRIERRVDRPSPVPQPPALPEPRAQLSRLYNGMVHAFRRLPIRGFLWYQGESNAFRAAHYRKSFPALIESWRRSWGIPDLPFYFVQLANFKSPPAQPGEDSWAELREAQTLALATKNTGMAVAIDVGEAGDIHPRNKQAVGQRLARLALARDYGKNIAAAGPVLSSLRFVGHRAVLRFEHCGQRLRAADGKPLRGFALAGKNRRWQWATARVVSANRVVVTAPSVSKPAMLRYGWATNPDCNLENSHGLPAMPFRTDQCPLTTAGNLWPF
jgi:sialate O-acetylesterase